ncbi:MAG: exosome complex protein Rrp42 [Infirmifilum sp.]|uniref:Exosome complex component Rrp42 n=1 Tax=Infirmifilum uzonense TaxID=1550241 RepID=A0A0F7FIC0_9CREN|nr:exosome complex protein Rrp42 [Infirmifilum uzonense]AKG39145.1 RNA-binding protein [Infirmifilum uzonense]
MSDEASRLRVLPVIKKELLLASLRKGERLDGRSPEEVRQITIQTGIIGKAEGSALVQLGETRVIAGVKLGLSSPFGDTPDEGVLIVNAELSPLASPFFEPGPPGEEDIELARVVDRGLRSAEVIDMQKLSIIPGSKVWAVFVDIYPLDHAGNILDAAGLAAMSALLNSKMPKTTVENGRITILEEKVPLPVRSRIVYVTLAKIGDYMVVDPSLEEELVCDAKITFGVTEDGKISAIQKSGDGSIKPSELLRARDMAIEVSKKLFEKLPPISSQEQ